MQRRQGDGAVGSRPGEDLVSTSDAFLELQALPRRIVLIGGGYQGNNPAVPNASATYMSADSTITADAIMNGSGGKVVLWANDSTRAYGSITARGGAQGGDGGESHQEAFHGLFSCTLVFQRLKVMIALGR